MMKGLRRWQLDSRQSLALYIAADARLSLTDYTNDQVWQLDLGQADRPTLALQTQYGGRVGLASIVPMWLYQGRVIYQYQSYHRPPHITHFAPNYLRAEADLLPTLSLVAEYWAMDSRALGAQFTLKNDSEHPLNLRLDLFAHVGAQGREQKLGIITYDVNRNAIHMGAMPRLNPVVVMPNATTDADNRSPKIGIDVAIEAQKSLAIRFVHAGLADPQSSLTFAQRWLAENWDTHLQSIANHAKAIPIIQTGDADWDWTIACAINRVIQAFFNPTAHLPAASFVSARLPNYGYSAKGDGSDYGRYWDGQDPLLSYQLIPFLATVHPDFARGIIHNYLARRSEDGFVDRKPGLGGQKQALLCNPILARMTWNYYQITGDKAFLETAFPQLWRFFQRWFAPDCDQDGDGIPEWQDERQMGYVAFPTFATWQTWSQGADVRLVESPDLIAYLLSEALCLQRIADVIGQKEAHQALEARRKTLYDALDTMWSGQHYYYRDRDTHRTQQGFSILSGGRGDQSHLLDATIAPPNRLIIKLVGGFSQSVKINLKIDGIDDKGAPIVESADEKAFLWQNRQAVYTTRAVFSQVHHIQCEGLSRVHTIHARTLDTTALDINCLLPLWSGAIPADKLASLVAIISDEAHFDRPNGAPMVSAQDAHYDPASANGGGAVWPLWVGLLVDGLLEAEFAREGVALLHNLLQAQTIALQQSGHFDEFYHSDTPQGLGTPNHLGGVVPLTAFLRAIGVFIAGHDRVWVGGPFTWKRGITIEQHGVTVKRTRKQTLITFPSGHKVKRDNPFAWEYIVDPQAQPLAARPKPKSVEPPITNQQMPPKQ